MWVSAAIQFLIAIFRAFPSIESLVKEAIERLDKAKAAEALLRKCEKDKLVDKAIDKGVGNDCEND